MIMSEKRAEAPVVGTILLVAIVVVLSAIVSYGFLGTEFLGGLTATATPVVAVDVDASESGLALTHSAGASLKTSDLVLVIRSETGDERVPFTSLTSSDGDGQFDAGDNYVYAAALSGYADVRVVHEPSGTVLYRGTALLDGDATLPGIDIGDSGVAGYNPPGHNQDVEGDVAVDGESISMTGNTWKTIEYPYTITDDTVLTFEFRSDAEGEIHAIGMLDADQFEEQRFFRLLGTQDWGQDDFTGYTTGDGWVRYEIPIGQYYQGDTGNIVFANDHDVSDPTANSDYRNINVYEAAD